MNSLTRDPLPLGILASGNGSNFQAIVDAIQNKMLHAQVQVLVVNNPDAAVIARAEKANIKVVTVEHGKFKNRREFTLAICQWLENFEVELVVLAGFMRILDCVAMERFPNRIINIHPALLPAFPGLQAPKQAFDYGCKITGVTVHIVDAGVDTGPIIAQRAIRISEEDTLESLEARIHQEEHKLYPEVIQLFAENQIHVKNGRVSIKKEYAHS